MYSFKVTILLLAILQAVSSEEILTKAQKYEVPEGGRQILDCQIKDNPKEEKTLWTKINSKGDKDVIYVGSFKVSRDPHFGKRFENNSIEIVNANKDDEGTYECLLTMGQESTKTKIEHTLVIQYKPVMDTNPQKIEVLEKNLVTIGCEAKGVPEPKYSWERKGKLPEGFNKESHTNSFQADPDVSGQYFCTASNILGSISRTIHVEVKFAPEITISEQVSSEQPSVRNIICSVRANPKPDEVSLYKIGSGSYAKESDTIEDASNPFLHRYTRVFTVRDEKDFGEYVCTSKNIYGEGRKTHNVTIDRPKPGKVQLISFPQNAVLTPGSQLSWYIRSEFEINRFEVKISKIVPATPSSTTSLLFVVDVKPKMTESGEYKGTYELTDLQTENTYQVGIKAINSYDQSSEIEFQVHLQKSSSSCASQSLFWVLLILVINLYQFKNLRLH